VHNEIEFTATNFIIVLLGLVVTYWMSRAPRSVLMLMNNRFPLDLDKRPWLVTATRYFGRFNFFMLISGMFLIIMPTSLANNPFSSLVTLPLAIGISVFALRKSKKEDVYSAAMKDTSQAGTGRSV
jgi:hypothetical protein